MHLQKGCNLNPDRKYSLTVTQPKDYEPGEPSNSDDLTALADHYKTDKGSIKHGYTPVYERYLVAWKDEPINLLEIGVACGSSLKMWSAYFPNASITGVDIRTECAELCKGYDRIRIDIADATTYTPDNPLDIVIDDGSHISLDIVKTWRQLWPYLKPGGLYVIEDLRCTFDPAYIDSFEWPRNRQDFSRRHLIIWLDDLMRLTDVRGTDIDFIHYWREMLVIGKK